MNSVSDLVETILSRTNIADTNELAEAVVPLRGAIVLVLLFSMTQYVRKLNVLPVLSLGTLLNSVSFRVATALRVGTDVCIPHSNRCDRRMDRKSLLGLSCKYSADRFPRYSAMNGVIKRALQKAGLPSVLKPPGWIEDICHALMV